MLGNRQNGITREIALPSAQAVAEIGKYRSMARRLWDARWCAVSAIITACAVACALVAQRLDGFALVAAMFLVVLAAVTSMRIVSMDGLGKASAAIRDMWATVEMRRTSWHASDRAASGSDSMRAIVAEFGEDDLALISELNSRNIMKLAGNYASVSSMRKRTSDASAKAASPDGTVALTPAGSVARTSEMMATSPADVRADADVGLESLGITAERIDSTGVATELADALHAYSHDRSFRFEIADGDERSFEKECLNRLFDAEKQQIDVRTSLIRNIAHEIKTPLTSLKLIADGIEDGIFSSEDEYTRITINENVARIDSTLRMMTQYAVAGRTSERELIGDMASAFSAAVEKAKVIGDRTGNVRVECSIDQRAAALPRIDVGLSSQSLATIFDSIIANSFEHAKDMRTLSFSMLVRESTSRGSSKRTAEMQVSVAVADDGQGVTPEMASMMCEPFWKGDESHALESGDKASPGLGLSIVKSMVESVGGKIEISCESGVCVDITLPIIDSDDQASESIEDVLLG